MTTAEKEKRRSHVVLGDRSTTVNERNTTISDRLLGVNYINRKATRTLTVERATEVDRLTDVVVVEVEAEIGAILGISQDVGRIEMGTIKLRINTRNATEADGDSVLTF